MNFDESMGLKILFLKKGKQYESISHKRQNVNYQDIKSISTLLVILEMKLKKSINNIYNNGKKIKNVMGFLKSNFLLCFMNYISVCFCTNSL